METLNTFDKQLVDVLKRAEKVHEEVFGMASHILQSQHRRMEIIAIAEIIKNEERANGFDTGDKQSETRISKKRKAEPNQT